MLQQHPRQLTNAFRIITRGFPHYRVAEGDSAELLQEELEFLSRMARVSIQGKVTSKKISTWLKSTFERNSVLAISPPRDHHTQPEDDLTHHHHHHDVDGYLTDTSCISHGDMADTFTNGFQRRRSLRRAISLDNLASATTIHHHRHVQHADIHVQEQGRFHSAVDDHIGLPTPDVSPEELSESSDILNEANHVQSEVDIQQSESYYGAFPDSNTIGDTASSGEPVVGPLSWLTESPFIDALVSWIEGPDHPVQQRNQDKDKPNPLLDIPLQFIAMLTYPEPDPKNGNKMTLAMVRETSFVRQRRKTLMMLTIYTLVVRYCSIDFFIAVLFASNCAMLFLMKNSGRMNVNMAKRAVRQRVGWAKQWAGGIFRRGNGSSNSNGNGNSHSQHSNSSGMHSPSTTDFGQHVHSSAISVNNVSVAADSSSQVKRRGLFGKRKTVDNTASSIHTSTAPSIHGTASMIGDTASILSTPVGVAATTQKKRFFKRNSNLVNSSSIGDHSNMSSNNIDSTALPPTTNASVPAYPRVSTSTSSPRSQVQNASSTSPNTARSTVMNVPLSSSPLAQSQSFAQSQTSPRKTFGSSLISMQSDSERTDTSKPPKPLSIVSTPPLLPGVPSAQRLDDPPTMALPPSIQSATPSASLGSQDRISTSHKEPGSFQLSNRSDLAAMDVPRRPLSPFFAIPNQNGRHQLPVAVTAQVPQMGAMIDEDEDGSANARGAVLHASGKAMTRTDATLENSSATTLDAVSSATADAMDL